MSELLYSNANITRDQLNLLETPKAQGRFHHPYSFGQYVDDIEEALNISGLKIANQEFETTHEHNRLFGVLEVQPLEGELITAEDWRLLVGLRGSHDRVIGRGLTLGSQVLVCSNLCFSGNIGTVQTKQTTNIETRLPQLLREAVKKIPEMAHLQEKMFDRYKEVELTHERGDSILVDLHRQGALNSNQLSRAISEWDKPSYEEHAAFGSSIWQLFNATTESLKPAGTAFNSFAMEQRAEKITRYMDELALA